MDSPVQILTAQLETLLIILGRPIVQRQLAALGGAVLVAWLLSAAANRLRLRLGGWQRLRQRYPRFHDTWRQNSRQLFLPAFALLTVQLTILLLAWRSQPTGLILAGRALLWAWLGYRLLVFLLYLAFGSRAVAPLHRRILAPVFLTVIFLRLFSRIIDLPLLAGIQLFTLFDASITLGRVLSAIVVLYAFIIAAWIIQELLGQAMRLRAAVDPGVAHSIVTISRYAIIAIGILLTLTVMGLDLSTLTIIGGGLSIGVGFGLQQIVANFISGLVLLFEQTLRPGDTIDLNGQLGTVQKLNIRSTIVRTNDNVEIIVPNETFLTSQLTTYTRTNRHVRMRLPFGVSYDSDPYQVRDLLAKAVERHGLVLANPAPIVQFMGFGESSLDFNLLVWIDQPHRMPQIRSDLYFMLWDALTQHNITIPFPQRDLNLGAGWEKWRNNQQAAGNS